MRQQYIVLGLLFGTCVCCTGAMTFQEWKSGIEWAEPPIVDPGDASTAPDDAIVLFDGTDLSAWKHGDGWSIKDEAVVCGGGDGMQSKQAFGDCQLHLEFASPSKVKGKGQGRGNSGVYLMGKYEIQILDSYENTTYYDGQCGAVYKQYPPLVNASRPPGEWQTYDIIFTAPRFDDEGAVESPGYLTVLHNGVLIQNDVELQGGTFWHKPPSYTAHDSKLPISLQNHGNPVRFRNIWVREVDQLPARKEAAGEQASAEAE